MRILLVHNLLWSHYKAAVFTELARLTRQEDIELLVLQMALTEGNRQKLGRADISLHQYPYVLLFNKSYQETNIFERIFKLIRQICLFAPDVLILPGYFDCAYWAALIWGRLKGIKVVSCFDSTLYDRKRFFFTECLKSFFLRSCDLVFCYGSRAREYLIRLKVSAGRIATRCQATWNDELIRLCSAYKEKPQIKGVPAKYFLYVGRISAEKNLGMLLSAWSHITTDKNIDEWGLVLVGAGEEEENLKQYVEKEKIKNVFFFRGRDWRSVVEFYSRATVFVLPSLSEPWGLVVNEAMLCGLPVIVSDHCGCVPELVCSGGNGFSFDPNDGNELIKLIRGFLNDSFPIKEMGKKSFEIIQSFSPQVAALQMLNGIKSLRG